jgi:hypothetical protein
MAMLPRFCQDVQGIKYGDASYNTSPNAAKWVAMMGKGFWHMHHYCWALINYQRAQRTTMPASQKRSALEGVRGDFWYVVNNTEADFVLLPEIYTWIGRMEVLLARPQEADAAFAKARMLKPDYWPAYFHWAEFLRGKGKKADALEVVKAGLQHSPGAKTLLVLFGDLGGKAADIPPPIVKKDTATAPDALGTEATEDRQTPAGPSPKQAP